jgi:SAM-dependent methyltransferase
MANIYGLAIEDHINNPEETTQIEVHSPDFDTDYLDPKYLLRGPDQWPEIEQQAMDWATGKILDVGALAGIHAEYLMSQGKNVTALEIDKIACEILAKKNIPVIHADIFGHLASPEYDTLLLLMNGLGMGGNFNEFENHINSLFRWLKPGGCIIADSSDLDFLNYTDNEANYYGELNFRLSYKEAVGEEFKWLYIDYESAKKKLQSRNYKMEMLVLDQATNHYLARITRE